MRRRFVRFAVPFAVFSLLAAGLLFAQAADNDDDPGTRGDRTDEGDGNGDGNGGGRETCGLILRAQDTVLQRAGGAWKDVSALFGCDPARGRVPDAIDRVAPGTFLVGDDDKNYRLLDVLAGRRTPLALPDGVKYKHGRLLAADGTLWWIGLQFTATTLWQSKGGANRAVYNRHGWVQWDVDTSGAVCWTVNTGLGENESSDFVDMIIGQPQNLFYAATPGGTAKTLAAAGCLRSPRFVDARTIAFWSNGPVTATRKTWILRTVDTASGAVTDVTRLEFNRDFRTARYQPPLVVGRGVYGWATDWEGDAFKGATAWTFKVAGKTRSFTGPALSVLPLDGRYTDGRVVFHDAGSQAFTVYDPVAGTRHEVPAGPAAGKHLYWVDTLPEK